MASTLPSRISRSLEPIFGRDRFRALQDEMDDLISRFSAGWEPELATRPMIPALDLSETDNALQVHLDVPGIKADELEVEVSGNTLRIHGEHKEEKEEKGKTYHRVERRTGAFSRSVTLPCAVQEEQVTAECHDGVLTITLPKTEEAKTHKIPVKSDAQ